MRIDTSHVLLIGVVLYGCAGNTTGKPPGQRSSAVLTVDQVELRYVREGRGDPLIVIGSSIYYPRAFSTSLRSHFDIIFADSRHFAAGFQPTPAELNATTLDTYVDDVEAVRRVLGLERMAVLGHSIHAQIALRYALKYPEHTSHVILVAGVPYAFSEFAAAQEHFWAAFASDERKSIHAANQALLAGALASAPRNRAFATTYRLNSALYWMDPRFDAATLLEGLYDNRAFGKLAGLIPGKEAIRASLEQLSPPTLIVVGRYDYAIPHSVWEALAAGIPRLQVHVLDGSSHSPQTEQASEFDRLLVKWFEDVRSDGLFPDASRG